jgi:putative phosphoesterase
MTRIGVIADTHGHLDKRVPGLFEGVQHILHAGDIGLPWIILELEEVAPVTAVLGNTDADLDFKLTEVVALGARKFLIHHILDPQNLQKELKDRVVRENPDVVVFGHSHKPFCQTSEGVLYFNPGYAGKARFNLPRSVAILTCDDTGITAEYLPL